MQLQLHLQRHHQHHQQQHQQGQNDLNSTFNCFVRLHPFTVQKLYNEALTLYHNNHNDSNTTSNTSNGSSNTSTSRY